MVTVKDITTYLETIAPPQLQEDYDNAGLIVGNASMPVKGVLLCLDSLETTIEEAIEKGCNLVVAHHPIVFKGLKRFNGKNYVERTVIKAIKNDIAIYAIHTNLDNVLYNGVNTKICERIGLKNLKVLAPKKQVLMKLTAFVPRENTKEVLDVLYQAGAGQIGNYKNCSFSTEGVGTFRPTGEADPHIGSLDKDEEVVENRIEVIFPNYLKSNILNALRNAHPYEEIAYYLHILENENAEFGSGMIGEIDLSTEGGSDAYNFLKLLKGKMNVSLIKHTRFLGKPIKKVAVCGGAGGFLLNAAIAAGADIFITSDYKYHEFFDADGRIVIADIGHYESEQFTIDLLHDLLKNKFHELMLFLLK